ncbi:MAG TPA: MBL fold metallo-hydrolase [Thermodesulfobacteriota bacterium]|nr:MBL fold metallo-hydrolase [Thermodesulfobacteriota bacterium]
MEVGPLAENTYIVGHAASGKAVVIDPGDEADEILRRLAGRGWILEKILLTHGHFDHVGAVAALKERTGASVHIHPADAEQMRTAGRQGAMFGLSVPTLPPPTCWCVRVIPFPWGTSRSAFSIRRGTRRGT